MPSMVQQQENTAEQSDVRRKKQATKRMEQLIKLHGADEPGLLDDIVPEAGEDHHRLSVNSSSVRKHVTIFNKLLITVSMTSLFILLYTHLQLACKIIN